MAISLNNSVSNGTGTPAAITGVIANRPAATSVAEGTIYISTDTQEIFSAQAGVWVKVSASGGGGSQNLAQVLAVGNSANNQVIQLDDNSVPGDIGLIQYTNAFSLFAFSNGPNISKFGSYIQNSTTNSGFFSERRNNGGLEDIVGFSLFQNQCRLYAQTIQGSAAIDARTAYSELAISNATDAVWLATLQNRSSADISFTRVRTQRKNNAAINKTVIAQTTKDNATLNVTNNQNATDFDNIRLIAENDNAQINLRTAQNNQRIEIRTSTLLGGTYIQQTDLSSNRESVLTTEFLRFTDLNSPVKNTDILPSFDAAGITCSTPEYNGIISNVNEKIVDANVDMSANDYTCQSYGVYVVTVGSNTNEFKLDNFINNGTDGQFVTICAGDVPIQCTNGLGNIFGTDRINSLGLFKLMKIGSDIYSSHL